RGPAKCPTALVGRRRSMCLGASQRGARRPVPGHRVDPTVAPDLLPTEEPPRRRVAGPHGRQGSRIRGPALEGPREPALDLVEFGPALERPTGFDADADERALGEDDIAVAGGVAIALPVADEDHA